MSDNKRIRNDSEESDLQVYILRLGLGLYILLISLDFK